MPFLPGHTTVATAKVHSDNSKLGDAAATYVAQVSCPSDCVFYAGGGCYAEGGRLGKFVTEPLNDAAARTGATALDAAHAEAAVIDGLVVPAGWPLRLHTVGDCATDEAARVVAAAAARYVARGGGPVWTYTHAWRTVARASWGTVSVLASCETAQDVWDARQRGYATAIVVPEFPGHRRYAPGYPGVGAYTAPGAPLAQDVLPCPAQTRGRTCSTCRLCLDDVALRRRGYSIGFEVHGVPYAQRAARAALADPADPQRRMTAEERVRLYLEEHPGATGKEIHTALGLHRSYTYQLLAYLQGRAAHPTALRAARHRRQRKRAAA